MKVNVGTPDRIVRLILGIILVVIPFLTNWALFESALWTWVSVIVGLVLAITALVRFCPIYAAVGMSSSKENE